MLGGIRSLLNFAFGRSPGVPPFLDTQGSLRLLDSYHVRERDKALLRSILVGGVWNGFSPAKMFQRRLCGILMEMDILFWNVLHPLLIEIRENPESHDLKRMDKSHWPRCRL